MENSIKVFSCPTCGATGRPGYRCNYCGSMIPLPSAMQTGQALENLSGYDVVLISTGPEKLQTIKALKESLNIGLKEAKELVDSAPGRIAENCSLEKAKRIKDYIEAQGAIVEIS